MEQHISILSLTCYNYNMYKVCLVKQLRETAGSEPHYQCNNEEMWHVILLHFSYVRSKYVSIIDLICFNYHTRTLYQPKPNFI